MHSFLTESSKRNIGLLKGMAGLTNLWVDFAPTQWFCCFKPISCVIIISELETTKSNQLALNQPIICYNQPNLIGSGTKLHM
jgi:hypothetical protein